MVGYSDTVRIVYILLQTSKFLENLGGYGTKKVPLYIHFGGAIFTILGASHSALANYFEPWVEGLFMQRMLISIIFEVF